MTNEELLIECKIGLGIQPEEAAFNDVLTQKLTAVKSFMRRAGVSTDTLDSEDAIGVLVMGVGDVWNQEAGTVKFSPAFISMVTQLTF